MNIFLSLYQLKFVQDHFLDWYIPGYIAGPGSGKRQNSHGAPQQSGPGFSANRNQSKLFVYNYSPNINQNKPFLPIMSRHSFLTMSCSN